MALWNDTTAPKWLLGEDAGVGLGSNHIKGITNTTPGNEIETCDDLPGIGWVQWHSKENGKILGEGRGWWEILATMDITGTAVTVNQRPVPSSTNEVSVELTADLDEITILAEDPNLDAITYEIVSVTGTVTADIPNETIGTIVTNGKVGTITWNATDALNVTLATPVTVATTNPLPTVADVTNLEYSLGAPDVVTHTLAGDVGLVGGSISNFTVDASGTVSAGTSTASSDVQDTNLTITIDNNVDVDGTITPLVEGDTITFSYTMTNSGSQTSTAATITVTVVT